MTATSDTVNPTGSQVGARIRLMRRRAGLTQGELADGRLSESYISLLESGRRRPTPRALELIAARLGCGVEELDADGVVLDLPRAELLIRRAEWETSSGQPQRAQERLRGVLQGLTRVDAPWLVIRARVAYARSLEATGLLGDALREWQEVMHDSEADNQHGLHTEAAVGICRCAREAGQLDYAIEAGERFWNRALADPGRVAVADDDLIVVGATLLCAYLELGNLARSRELSDQLVALAEKAATPMAVGAALWNAALAAEAEGRVAEALRLAERAAQSMTQTSDVRNRARLQTALGGLHLRKRPPDAVVALQLLGDAEPVLIQFGSVVDVAYCRTEMARAHLTAGDAGAARDLSEATVADLDAAGGQLIQRARTLMVLALASYALGDTDAARAVAEEAATALERTGATRQAAATWADLAELCVAIDDPGAALAAYRKATGLLGISSTPPKQQSAVVDLRQVGTAQAS